MRLKLSWINNINDINKIILYSAMLNNNKHKKISISTLNDPKISK